MKKKKQVKETKFCEGGKCNCDTKKTLANIFPYHLPNCLTEAEFDSINTNTTPAEELGYIYGRVFNSDNSYTEKRYNQLKRIAKEYK